MKSNITDNTLLLTVAETAHRLRLSRSKTYDLISRKVIGHYRLDGKIFVAQADIEAYLASSRVDAVTPQRIRLRDVQV